MSQAPIDKLKHITRELYQALKKGNRLPKEDPHQENHLTSAPFKFIIECKIPDSEDSSKKKRKTEKDLETIKYNNFEYLLKNMDLSSTNFPDYNQVLKSKEVKIQP